VPVTEQIQVWYINRVWQWRRVNLLNSEVLSTSNTTFDTPHAARDNALIAHPGMEVALHWVSEAGPEWHRYQDA
jgi:hypothetical protein